MLQIFGAKPAADVYSIVMADIQKVRKALSIEIQSFQQSSLQSDREKGQRLLFLFQRDLLPGVNAMILESKGKRDALASDAQVEAWQKAAAWCAVTALNATLLLYIYLFAVGQSSVRQRAWFQSFMVWLIMEIFGVSTMVVLIAHVVIPAVTMRDLHVVKQRLLKTIRDYRKAIRGNGGKYTEPEEPSFNVANYFFVSTRLSKSYTKLDESKIISRFSSPWPHQSYQRTRSLSKTYSKKFSSLVRAGSMIIIFLLKGVLQMPPGIQDMVFSLSSMVASGNLLMFVVQMWNMSPILPFIFFGILFLFGHFAVKSVCSKNLFGFVQAKEPFSAPITVRPPSLNSGTRIDAVTPINEAPSHGDALITIGEDASHSQAKKANGTQPADHVVASRPFAADGTRIVKSRRESIAHGLSTAKELQSLHASDGDVLFHSKGSRKSLAVSFWNVPSDEDQDIGDNEEDEDIDFEDFNSEINAEMDDGFSKSPGICDDAFSVDFSSNEHKTKEVSSITSSVKERENDEKGTSTFSTDAVEPLWDLPNDSDFSEIESID